MDLLFQEPFEQSLSLMEMSHIQVAGLDHYRTLAHLPKPLPHTFPNPSHTPPTPLPPPLWSDIDYTILVLIHQNFFQLPVIVVCSSQLCMYDDLHTLVATGGIPSFNTCTYS